MNLSYEKADKIVKMIKKMSEVEKEALILLTIAQDPSLNVSHLRQTLDEIISS